MSLESGYTATLVIHRPGGDVRIVMETWEGGNIDSDESKHRNAVTRKQTARGGLRSRGNVTMTRECDAEIWGLREQLEDSSGRDKCTGIRQMVGPRGEAIGKPWEVTGVFKATSLPDYDLSGDEVGMFEAEVSADEEPTR